MTSAAMIAALAFEPIAHAATEGDAAAIATNFAYPVGDLILLALVVAALALSGWRPGRAWLLLAIGLALSAIADTAYLYQSAKDTYVVGGLLDSMWIASALAIGLVGVAATARQACVPGRGPPAVGRTDGLRDRLAGRSPVRRSFTTSASSRWHSRGRR